MFARTVVLISLLLSQIVLAKEVIIGFEKPVNDKDLLVLVNSCKAQIQTLWYTTPYGGGGSSVHRKAKNNAEIIKNSRDNIEKMLGKYGYIMTGINLQILSELITVEDLKTSKKLMTYMKGLLNSYYQQKLSYEYIKSGKPLYFSAIIEIPSGQIYCLKRSNVVKVIKVYGKNLKKYVPYYFRPKNIPEKYMLPVLKNIRTEKLYELLKKTVKELKKDSLYNRYAQTTELRGYKQSSRKYLTELLSRTKKENRLLQPLLPDER
ncbi:hypothetical protein [Persephonella sp.]